MSDSDFERRLAAWIDEGPTTVSDRVIDGALAQLPTVRQHGAFQVPLRSLIMRLQPLAPVLGVAALVVAALGVYVALSGPNLGGPDPTPSPTATPEPTMVLGTFSTSEFAVPFSLELGSAVSTEGWAVSESASTVVLTPDVDRGQRVIVLPRDQTQLILADGAQPIGADLAASLSDVTGVDATQQTAFDTGEPAVVNIGGVDVPWIVAQVSPDDMAVLRTLAGETLTRASITEEWWLFDVPSPDGGILIIYRGGDDPGLWGGSVMAALESLQFESGQ